MNINKFNEAVRALKLPACYPGTRTVGSGYSYLEQDMASPPAANELMLVTSTGPIPPPSR